MMAFIYSLTGLVAALASLNIVQFFSFRAQKKRINAEAQQQVNTADLGRFENLEKEITFLGRLVDKYREETTAQGEQLRFKQQGYERQLKGIQKLLSKEVNRKRYAEYRICENLLCTDRKPTLGEFHTEDSEIAQNEVV